MKKAGKLFAASIVFATWAWAQTEVPPPPPPAQPDNGPFYFKMIAERGAVDMKAIKGAPYSAEQTTTTTQTLNDGNRIVQTSTAKFYRDMQGRTRIDHSLGSIGDVGAAQKRIMIMIDDPVAGVHYTLDPENHVAHKAGAPEPGLNGKLMAEKLFAEKAQGNTTLALPAADGVRVVSSYKPSVDLAMHTDELGTQTVEGLQAAGTRTTVTIPAGAEGNEQPMQITDERWYSSELQTNVKTIHTDPRMGQTVFVLNNVSRGNPDPSLFQVPADYQVSEVRADPMVVHVPPPSQ